MRISDGSASLKTSFPDKPARRLELVEDLLKIVPAGAAGSLHDPALRNLLENERRRLKPIVEQVLGAGEIRDAIKELKRPLYPYQREGVDRFLAAGRLLLADDMGLGKTAQAIACCNILRHSGRVRRGLIIAPASLKPQWAREWASFSDLPIHVVDGNPEERQAAYTSPQGGVSHHQLRAAPARPGDRPRAGTPNWSCSTKRNGSRTGRPRRPSRSKA